MIKLFQTLLLLFILLLTPKNTLAEESIKNFDVNITAHQDGAMTIEENIKYDFALQLKVGKISNDTLIL